MSRRSSRFAPLLLASFARVMEHLGTSYGVLRKERCTGDPARRLGNDLLFDQLAESNLDGLKQAKVSKIVSICPHCVRTISADWPAGAPAIEHRGDQALGQLRHPLQHFRKNAAVHAR